MPKKTLLDYGVLNLADDSDESSSPPVKKSKPTKNDLSKPKTAKESKAKEPKGAADKLKGDVPHQDPMNVFEDIEVATNHGKKRLSIEQIYQKKSQLEHILLRPDTYIGSVEVLEQPMWVYDTETEKMVHKKISYVPGLYKIFDEIIVNAADNKQRDKKMNCIKVKIDADKNEISIWNNGKGIPVVEHKLEKMYVPELIFGTLLTSSNYDDSERKVTGGRNGYGAKLCNIFSTKFTVETSSREYKKSFKQTWKDNMSSTEPPKIGSPAEEDYSCITFSPDLAKFKMQELDSDIIGLMSRRAFDIAGTSKDVKVYLNGKRLPIKGFKDYVDQYTKDKMDENNQPLKTVLEQAGDRWEVGLTVSDRGFQQVSFVNSIATTKGGRHVDYVTDQIVEKMIDHIKKQLKKTGINIRPFQIKNHMWVFVNCLIENPTFDSQTKENMTLQAKSFGSKCQLSDTFLKNAMKCGVVDSVMQWVQFKAQAQLNLKCHATKHSKLKGIPKLEDANDAGTKRSTQCTLILTEGDSAKTLAVAGLGVIGRDHYGVFPLRGKVLNVREASHKQIMENAEINNMIKILGLQYKKNYKTMEDLQSLRYGKVMIMTDQDQDGSHIKGLLINFFHHNWPSLIKQNFVEEFITPIVKVTKGSHEIPFFSLPEYDEWKAATENWHTWKVKYYKGLGTSTSNEAKQYFSDMNRHKIRFRYGGDGDDVAIELAFSKQKIEERKTWLTDFMADRKRRRENNLPDIYLYEKNTTQVTYKDFVDKELVLFSNMDNERSIPCLIDGLKPGQRKVLFTCFKRNDKREVKVAQLAGSIAEMSAYHHGEVSLMSTIVNLAQNFVGSNNLNYLLPIGQFGSRLLGGKDSASPRYIFTMLSPVTRTLFHVDDDNVLRYLSDDNKKIEPQWYCPVIPTVLVNGSEGIGTGYSTKIPNFNPREIAENIRRLINGQETLPMNPWYKHFKGEIISVGQYRFVSNGEVYVDEDIDGKGTCRIEITELPVGTWTQNYKECVLEPLLQGSDKQPPKISDFKEYHTDTLVKFIVDTTRKQFEDLNAEGLHKALKLQATISTSNMILFDAVGYLKRYETADDIMQEFYTVRYELYVRRKKFLVGFLQAEASRLSNLARFVMEKIDNIIKLENIEVKVILNQLVTRKYDSDPIKKWKDDQKKMQEFEDGSEEEAEDETEAPSKDSDSAIGVTSAESARLLQDYNYLLSTPAIKFSKNHKDVLLKERDKKLDVLETLRRKEVKDFWLDDLDKFTEELDKQEKNEREEGANAAKKISKKMQGQGKLGSKSARGGGGNESFAMATNGMRIAPSIDAAIKEKFVKADQLKDNKAKGVVTTKRGQKAPVEKPGKENGTIKKFLKDGKKEENDNDDDVKIVSDDDDDLLEMGNSPIFRTDRAKALLAEKPKKLKKTTSKTEKVEKKKTGAKIVSDSEDEAQKEANEEDDEEESIRISRPARPRKEIKYNFDEDDESDESAAGGFKKMVDSDVESFKIDEDDDDDDFEIGESEKKKRRDS